jgi:hypothetical protein
MHGLHKEKELIIKLDTTEMTPSQIRLLKSINGLLVHVLTADDEAEYFDASAELLKKAADVIRVAQFAEKNNSMGYGQQALEYAVDFLNETLNDKNLIDN